MLPEVTHLQFLVLSILMRRSGARTEIAGRDVRAELLDHGLRKAGPAFYQLMNRLEESGWVTGRYRDGRIDRYPVKERIYAITSAGARVWSQARIFYEKVIAQSAAGSRRRSGGGGPPAASAG